MADSNAVFGVTTGQFTLTSGVTNALLVDGGTVPGCNSVYLEYFAGGTVQILGVTYGATLTGAQLVAAGVTLTGFVLPTGRGIAMDGPARFYLAAASTQSIVQFIFGKSAGL